MDSAWPTTGSRGLGDVSFDGECLLQSTLERDRFPCWHSPAPVLLKELVHKYLVAARSCLIPTFRPAYLSYGAFGQVAAHELTHAFDSAGRMYNQQGKLEEWWTNTTTEGFQRKQDCIVQQYSGMSHLQGLSLRTHALGSLHH